MSNTIKVEAVKAEVETTKTIEFDGETYTVPVNALDDVEVLEAWEDDKHVTLCRILLGADQWKLFKAKKRTLADMFEILTAILNTEGAAE